MRRLMALVWMLPGCLVDVKFDDVDIDVGEVDSGADSGIDPREDPDWGDEATTEVMPRVVSWLVLCDEESETVQVSVDSEASRAVFFQQETANMTPQWSEEHALAMETNNFFSATLETETDVTDWVSGESTVFWCDIHIDFEIPIMTYAVAIFDGDDGPMLDCVTFGHDPQGLIDGDYPTAGSGPSFPIESCRVGY